MTLSSICCPRALNNEQKISEAPGPIKLQPKRADWIMKEDNLKLAISILDILQLLAVECFKRGNFT